MNGSRSAPNRHGDRSSLDALNRTIEGLEARIEGLMSGTARDGHPPRTAELPDPRPSTRIDPLAGRRAPEARPMPAAAYRDALPTSDPLAEIRERQRMLEANRGRTPKAERPRHAEVRPPEAYPQADVFQPDNGMRDIANALVSLRQELKQDIAEGVAREMNALRSEIRSIRSIAEDQRFNDDLRGDLARLADGINQLGHQATPEAAGLRAEFEELRTVMGGLAREDSVMRMETRWQGLEERMHELDSAALRDELVALADRIDDIKGQLGAMSDSPVIRALEQKLMTVAGAMEQLGSRMQPHDTVIVEQFATLDLRLDEISRAIAASSRASAAATIDQAFLRRLEGRIGELAEQIDTISRAAQVQVDPTEAFSARIEALTGRIEELADEQAAMRLEERLEQLSVMMEQAHRPQQQTDLSDHLADISRKIDGLEHGSVNDALAERLDYLARRIEEATARPSGDHTALRSLEDQIAHLSVLISQPQHGTGLPADFDNRMSAIEGYMATNDEYIIEAARQAAEAVVEAYSRNTAGGTPMAATEMAALSALADDLRHLEDLTRSSEDRTHQTFEALHGTLVQIADRLDGMEERLAISPRSEPQPYYAEQRRHDPRRAAPAMPAAAQLSVASPEDIMREGPANSAWDDAPVATFGTRTKQHQAEPEAIDTLRASESDAEATTRPEAPARQSLLTGLSRRFLPGGRGDAGKRGNGNRETAKGSRAVVDPTPSIDPSRTVPSDHENDLIEPGSGAPDVKKILERVRASQAAGDFDSDRNTAAARADYIAAARRAAKAAAQEADPSQGAAPAKDLRKAAKPASSKGMGGKLSQYRRPILMAVGAVLLALMAMPLAKTLTGGSAAPSASVEPARIEAPAQPMTAHTAGNLPLPEREDQAATDSAENDGNGATPALSPLPLNHDIATDHLTDPRPAAGEPSAIEPAGTPTLPQPQPQAEAEIQPQDSVAAAPAIETPAAIVVPAGLQPKSLADAAAAGDPNALFEIGARFTEGRGVKSDASEAANWYKLAADRGLAPAQYRLANLFEKGTGVNRDLSKAAAYYRQAADAGHASAMHNLAVLYASGAAGQPDYAEAVSWFEKAADLGVADSQFNLAILLARGNGVRQDLEESYKWFAVAARDGDKDAAQKRDEVANAMRQEQLESARAKVDLWKVQPLDAKANSINVPDEWAAGKPLTTASVDMEKAIRNVQAILGRNGFDAGTPDGKMGAKTVSAIKAFQTSIGQEPNGKINEALVRELLARNR